MPRTAQQNLAPREARAGNKRAHFKPKRSIRSSCASCCCCLLSLQHSFIPYIFSPKKKKLTRTYSPGPDENRYCCCLPLTDTDKKTTRLVGHELCKRIIRLGCSGFGIVSYHIIRLSPDNFYFYFCYFCFFGLGGEGFLHSCVVF